MNPNFAVEKKRVFANWWRLGHPKSVAIKLYRNFNYLILDNRGEIYVLNVTINLMTRRLRARNSTSPKDKQYGRNSDIPLQR
jgi:hypothetical protein